ncbi:MAG: 5-deoxy-glucuronate isomerase [Blastocatellia bacterium]|jgi:5-deoxy-D-glucuronate isomerase|nr:5-deoxy-glucuronate isomerase [Blastocatellia bacterium]
MSTQMQETSNRIIFRRTNARKGRHLFITPQNSSMKHLVYGRIILDKETPRAAFATGELETGLICLSGECMIKADGETHEINRYDSRQRG